MRRGSYEVANPKEAAVALRLSGAERSSGQADADRDPEALTREPPQPRSSW
jgi:hypothetical protein